MDSCSASKIEWELGSSEERLLERAGNLALVGDYRC